MKLFIAALFVCCLATLVMAYSAYSRRDVLGAKALLVQMLGLSWWTLSYALQLIYSYFPSVLPHLSHDPLFWFKVLFLGVVVIPAGFLVFVLQYTGIVGKLPRWLFGALAVVPAVTLVSIATDPMHDGFLGGFQPGQGMQFQGGPAFWLHTAYSYLVVLCADILLLRFVLVAPPVLRAQALVLLMAAATTSVANIISISHVLPKSIGHLDISPFGFLITVMVMLYNVRRRDFLTLMPIARTRIVEHMQDSVLVVDHQQRLTDYNPAADALFADRGRRLKPGAKLSDILPELAHGKAAGEGQSVLLRSAGQEDRYLNVQLTSLGGARHPPLGHILVLRDVTEIRRLVSDLRKQLDQNERLRQELKEQAIRDPLTGLFNRRWMELTLDRELARAERESSRVAVCLLDLDHFKGVNDNFGHGVGDRVLCALAEDIGATIRDMDVGCRYGGEEFLIILPGANQAQAIAKVDQLRYRLASRNFSPDGPDSVTLSAGVAVFPAHGNDRPSIVRSADEALYAAKAAGRNQVVGAH